MTDFKAPVEDILFSLRHVAGAAAVPGWDDDTAQDILQHFGQFAEGVIAPLNGSGDQQGARLENGRVRLPDGFRDAYRQMAEDGWQGLTAPEAYGGMGVSALVGAGVSEIFSGANHSMQMVCNLVPGAIQTLMKFGTDAQRAAWIPRLASGEVLSTMCLTEPASGSDLSGLRTQATRAGAGWRLNGEKIFISGGDQDMSDDVLHLVLARSGTAEQGMRGLSLFLCTRQPGVAVTRIEEKMGLHASPTCQMVFDDAEAELIGPEGAGLAAMFTVMNHARLDVALQGAGHAAQAARIAADYADERRQGRTRTGAPARLSDHADVQRMLDRQAILAFGARAMCHITLVALETEQDPALVEILTSLCKVYGSEAGTEAADLGMQILGGYGYLTEYGLEQIWRDARICAIYEGTNGIHARTLVTRGLRPEGTAAFEALISTLAGATVLPALADWQALRSTLEGMKDPTPLARRYYEMTARVFAQAVWARIRTVADEHPQADRLARLSARVLEEEDL